MPSISDTIRQLRPDAAGEMGAATSASARLVPLTDFGTNPGALDGWFYAPATAGDIPLVVVLHGCTQTAAGYDHGSGWSDLAERHGFAVLFPEQRRANNANRCFNWFATEDTARDRGEALSIRQMIGALVAREPIDPRRIFVTGLSAGGAMTAVMLATYPELFAGGSIIAGLPYGAATSMPQAFERMRGVGHGTDVERADRVRRASAHDGAWPSVSVWHGDADRTVDIANADAIVGQWRLLHGAGAAPDRVDRVDGQQHRVWLGRDGREAVEEYRIAGLGHGIPLKTGGADGCGAAGPHLLEAGISSTWRQAERWHLLSASPSVRRAPAAVESAPAASADSLAGVSATIERALRSAGLMR